MGLIIDLMILILFIVLILWTWNSTKNFEITFTRFTYIVCGILINFIIVLIVFNISKSNIDYTSIKVMKEVRKKILLTFIPLNGLITMPFIANIINKIKDGENQKKRILVISIISILIILLEIFYFKSIQVGILKMIKLS